MSILIKNNKNINDWIKSINDKWLEIALDSNKNLKLRCLLCKKYKDILRNLANFDNSFIIGITDISFTKEIIYQHLLSNQHKKAEAIENDPMDALGIFNSEYVNHTDLKKLKKKVQLRSGVVLKNKENNSNDGTLQINVKSNKRQYIGGKRREWSAQCLKILENLMKDGDAKLLCLPLDPIVHQEFYTMSEDDPLDLSKIMLNFHGGKYYNFFEFRQDIEIMFDQYKRYFANKDMKIFNKLEELEFSVNVKLEKNPHYYHKIIDATKKKVKRSVSITINDSLSERIQKIEDENERILSQADIPKTALKFKSDGEFVEKFKTMPKFDDKIKYTFHKIDKNPSNSNPILISQANKQADISHKILRNTSMESELLDEMNCQVDGCLEREMEKAGVQVLLNVTSIWFGTSRQLPFAPIIVKEKGFYMRFLIEDKEDMNMLVDFQIPANEIVRCCGYHGSEKKHTIFIFLLPSCVTRMYNSKLIGSKGMEDEASISSSLHATLVAIFMPTLREDDRAKLIYLMWSMGKYSLFKSTDFYSEIDQAVALKLTCNTNPNILKKDRFVVADSQIISSIKKRNSTQLNGLTNANKFIIPTTKRKIDDYDVSREDDGLLLEIKEEPIEEEEEEEEEGFTSNNSSPS